MTIHRTMRSRLLAFGFISAVGALPLPAWAFSNLVVFGDSLSDIGNVYNQTFTISPQSPPYYQGRYSNGPLWIEDLAIDQGMTVPTRSRSGGSDWAYGGVKTGSGATTFTFFSFPNLGTQINNYLAGHTPSADQLFVVWGGGNDFLDGQTNALIPVTNIANHVTALANAGAKQFIVPNLPPLGEIPRNRGTASQTSMDAVSNQFNLQLATTLTNLSASLHVQIYQLDVAGFFQKLFANPSAYGFTDVTHQALVNNTAVANPDDYLFWDDVHPTRVGHSLLASAASDLLDTHNWTAGAASASFADASNWGPPGTPDARWIANLINSSASARTAVVSSNSSVREINIYGASQKMEVAIRSGATLSATQLNMANDASLAFELAGNGQHGKMALSGAATLGGAVAVTFADGFVSLPGSSYQILTFGSRNGDLTVSNRTGFSGLTFSKTYSSTSLTLTASALGGDANLDGIVDVTDLGALATNWQTSANWLGGDFNSDDFVDVSDLGILATNWQSSSGSLDAALAAVGINYTSVPEPSVGIMATCLAAAASRRRARRGQHQSNSSSTATEI